MKCKVSGKTIIPFMSFGKMPMANGFLDKKDFKNDEFVSDFLRLLAPEFYEPRVVNLAASFVYNLEGDKPYVELAVEEEFKFSKGYKNKRFTKIPIKVVVTSKKYSHIFSQQMATKLCHWINFATC